MRVLRFILHLFQIITRTKPLERNTVECKRPICGSFFIETVYKDGRTYTIQVDANELIRKGGKGYLRGWCYVCPFFHSVPIERIAMLSEQKTGALITQEDIEDWLNKRTLN